LGSRGAAGFARRDKHASSKVLASDEVVMARAQREPDFIA
jgi:hypothetical protein